MALAKANAEKIFPKCSTNGNVWMQLEIDIGAGVFVW